MADFAAEDRVSAFADSLLTDVAIPLDSRISMFNPRSASELVIQIVTLENRFSSGGIQVHGGVEFQPFNIGLETP